MQVREVMSRDVLVASPDDTIEKAAILMGQVNCIALPVAENDRLVGMITDRDIALRAFAKGNPPDRMSGLQVRRLPVLNRQKRLVEIVSLGDLVLKNNGPAASALEEISKPA